MSLPTLAHPGQPLGPASKYAPGPGTHIYNSQIYASLGGPVIVKKPTPASAPPKTNPTVKSSQATAKSAVTIAHLASSSNTLPTVDSVVLCRVTRIQTRQATVAILVVGDDVCKDEFNGVIRREDVRATEKDKVVLGDGFRPGDIVRALVISLGDQSNYYLSTAKNELGVMMATSEAGNAMYPISWKEFKDPVTGQTETRKVAKPF
ncbi:3-5 exoribonuclease csl4 protein [Lasallia pustulata]|uniref:3-5 exoribonuclease csl4 protein n=1 Tax=Lasallia pustulata TaxID=136370 RepID=A0A1W5D593_9LECA|nr:3-5 exoribonuclease csl4 protein [Lasallia pustulata]